MFTAIQSIEQALRGTAFAAGRIEAIGSKTLSVPTPLHGFKRPTMRPGTVTPAPIY
jgi:hypothetical protein